MDRSKWNDLDLKYHEFSMRPFPFPYWLCNVLHTIPTTNTSRDQSIKSKSRDIMFSGSNIAIHGGTFNNSINRTTRGMDALMEWVATGAFHNSDELYDAPKCHPRTRVAVLDDIMEWVNESESAQDDFMMWLFGPAGAGKSAIAKRIAELAAEEDLLIGDFFFSRTSSTRNTKDRLIATLAYQLTVSIPDTRVYIEDAIERDPAIFHKNILTQIDTLIIKPLQPLLSSTQTFPSQKLIIIDGLDECNDSKAQVAILEAISHFFTQYKLSIKFLVVSRPEPDLVTTFNCNGQLRFIHRRLSLDDTYRPDDDIRLFLSDKFQHIKHTHLMRSTIPITWPTQETLDRLVDKSSGQFMYASTVIKFVESSCHRPTSRLNIILGISPPGKMNPFAQLDALYNHLLSSVDDIQITLRVLGLYLMTPSLAFIFRYSSTSPEPFLSLEPGDIQLALLNLSSILTYHESSGEVEVLHASLVDFLSDKWRSTIYYIDKEGTCTDFVRRILQCVKGPDGVLAGHAHFFRGLTDMSPYILAGQLRSDILHFDLDAFINASIRWQYKGQPLSVGSGYTINIFRTWKSFLNNVALEDRDKKEAQDRLNKSFESRLQIYHQSHWQLQLLLAFTVPDVVYFGNYHIPYCRSLDILLEMDDHCDLHLVDQNALDLRHAYIVDWPGEFIDVVSRYVDGDTYSSAALHCMRFLSNPPEYYARNDCPEAGLIYVEWKDTCTMTLEILCNLLQQANTSPELVQFISNNDIHQAVQKGLSVDDLRKADMHILAFLGRAGVCPNWRIISAIERSPITTHQKPSKFEENNAISHSPEEWRATQRLIRQRLDQCCLNGHLQDYPI